MSSDGRFVAFSTAAENLGPEDHNFYDDIYVVDRQTGAQSLVSVSSSGAAANLDVNDPAISADGRFVAFRSSATTLVAGDTLYCGVYNCADIFVRDRQNQTTVRVSIAILATRRTTTVTIRR